MNIFSLTMYLWPVACVYTVSSFTVNKERGHRPNHPPTSPPSPENLSDLFASGGSHWGRKRHPWSCLRRGITVTCLGHNIYCAPPTASRCPPHHLRQTWCISPSKTILIYLSSHIQILLQRLPLHSLVLSFQVCINTQLLPAGFIRLAIDQILPTRLIPASPFWVFFPLGRSH